MKIRRKWIPLLLAGLLAAAPLAGCGEENDATQSGDVAMGRYIEEEWQFPFEAVNAVGIHRRPDGRIALLLNGESGEQRYFSTSDGSDWQEEIPDWLAALRETSDFVRSVHFNSKGEGAALYYLRGDESYTGRVALLSPDGTVTTTPIGSENPWPNRWDDFSGEEESGDDGEEASPAEGTPEDPVDAQDDGGADGEQAGLNTDPMYITDVVMGEDGFVYVNAYGDVGRFDPRSGTMETGYLRGSTDFALAGDRVAQFLYPNSAELFQQVSLEESSVLFSDADSGDQMGTQPADAIHSSGGSVCLAGLADGTLYLAGRSGLFRLAAGGETWEKIVEGGLSSFSLPSMGLQELIPHGENEFLALFYSDSSSRQQLMNYVYSPDTPTRPDTELTVFAMFHDQTVPQAVGAFRKQYPNVLINIQSASDENAYVDGMDAIRVLNTELLAGKGPDLIVLDNTPLQDYIDKGVLADLSDVVAPMLQSGELLENIVTSLEQGGKLYAVPTRFTMPTLWGDKTALKSAGTLAELADYAQQHPDRRAFVNLSPQMMAFQFGRVSQHRFLGGDGQVDVDALERFFTDLKRLCDTDGGRPNLDGETIPFSEEYWHNANVPDTGGVFAVAYGDADLMFGNLDGFSNIMMPNGAVYRQNGGESPNFEAGNVTTTVPDGEVREVFRPQPGLGGSVFFPNSIIGVNARSEKLELAKEFVRAMLGEGTQNMDVYNGFPVNKNAIGAIVAQENDMYSSHSYMGEDGTVEREVEASWPSGAMLRAVADAFGSLDTPVIDNYELMELVIHAFESYHSGERTAREAAESVRRETRLMLAE